jgi:putative tricarboxylic transport membrane protein
MLASFAAYSMEKRSPKHPQEFGKGAIEGVAGPESANNAGAQTSFIPMLTLGIPGQPGDGADDRRDDHPGHHARPERGARSRNLFWGLIASMWIGNLLLVVLNLPLIGIWVKLLTVPYHLLFPTIMAFCCIGVYSVKQRLRPLCRWPSSASSATADEARLRAGAAAARLHPGADAGGTTFVTCAAPCCCRPAS